MRKAISGRLFKIISGLVLVLFVSSSLISINSDATNIDPPVKSRSFGNAMNGEGMAVDMASSYIIGQEFPGPGGLLGTFIWTGDLDQDNLTDMAIASSEAPGNPETGPENTGYLYIWLGSGGPLPSLLDLDDSQPDILIRGGHEFSRLLSSMDIGDLNDDGIDDLILGVSLHPECGRVFILWGNSGGWPSIIDLPDPGRLSPNGDPYGFLRTQDYWIIGGHLSPVPWPEATYDTGDSVFVEDLDKDGSDDLIFSSPGWHHIVILWGTGDRYTLGNDMTIIDDSDVNSKIGDSMDIGDIDNDGWLDLVAGAPFRSNETVSKYESGIVYVYFNISRARDGTLFDTFDLSHPTIWGTGSYDRFGFKVQLYDVDNDGNDDIVVGSPDADGPSNQRNGAGEIMIFKGGTPAKFERFMDANSDSDIRIYGDRIQTGDIPGDSTGRTFSIGDIDGDGAAELVIGFPRRIDTENDDTKEVGAITGYETRTVFTTPSALVDLRIAEKRFEYYGSTENDNLGYTVHIDDINNDGAMELIASAPSADGIGDTRVGAGEVYIYNGTKISILGVGLSGQGMKDGTILPGRGDIYVNLTFRHSNGPGSVNNAFVEFMIGPNIGRIGWIDGQWYDDIPFMDLDKNGSSFDHMGDVGKVSLRITPDINFRFPQPADIVFKVNDTTGSGVSRKFLGVIETAQSFVLLDKVDLAVDGEPVGTSGLWVAPGSSITFSGLGLGYGDLEEISIPNDIVHLDLFRNGSLVDSILFGDGTNTLSDTVPDESSIAYAIVPRTALDPPQWTGPPYMMRLEGMIDLELSVDNTPPLPPSEIYLEPDEGRISIFDDDNDWKVKWEEIPGNVLDPGSSVKEFLVSLDGSDPVVAREPGGLFGSYYNGTDHQQLVFERIDSMVDFPVSEWKSFGPDPNSLNYNSFSIRWNGWVEIPATRTYQFALAGTQNGHVKLVMNGKDMIPWSRLTSPQISPSRFYNEGDLISIQIYYYFNSIGSKDHESGVSFQYLNDKGLMVPVPSSLLYFPTNNEEFKLFLEDEFTVSVSSVNWVGRESSPTVIRGYKDTTDPIANLSGFLPWYGTPTPTIRIGFRDPSFNGIPSSGLAPSTLRYRLRERSDEQFTDWMSDGIEWYTQVMGIEASTSIGANFTLDLVPSWRGAIQWKISDIVGNTLESSVIDFGIDSSGPVFELLSPNIQIVQKEGYNDLVTRVTDRPGVGIDMNTLRYRIDSFGTWSEWKEINANGSGEEIIFELSVILPAGENLIQFKVSDLVGNEGRSIVYKIIAAVVIENRAPVPRIRAPVNATVIKIGNPLTLDASNTMDDGLGPFDHLRYTWISNIDGVLGTGIILDVYLKNLGEHRIRLYVDDGEFNVSTSIFVTLDPSQTPDDDDIVDDDDNGLQSPEPDYITPVIFFFIFIVILAIGFFLILKRYREKQEDETRLEYVEKTEDDDEYDRRLEEEERSLGISVEKDERTAEEIEAERRSLYGDD